VRYVEKVDLWTEELLEVARKTQKEIKVTRSFARFLKERDIHLTYINDTVDEDKFVTVFRAYKTLYPDGHITEEE